MINLIKTIIALIVSVFASIIKGIGAIFNNIGFTLVECIENQGPTAPAEEAPNILGKYFGLFRKFFG